MSDLKIISTSQICIHKYENLKRKLYNCNVKIYFNWTCHKVVYDYSISIYLYYNFGLSVMVFPHAETFHCPLESRRIQEPPPTQLSHTFIFVISLIDTVPFLCFHFTYCLLLMCFGHWCLIYGLSFF